MGRTGSVNRENACWVETEICVGHHETHEGLVLYKARKQCPECSLAAVTVASSRTNLMHGVGPGREEATESPSCEQPEDGPHGLLCNQ